MAELPPTIEGRIRAVKRYADAEDYIAGDYLKALIDNVTKIDERFQRNALLSALLVSIFVLLANSDVATVTVGAFKLRDITPIYKFLPVVIAYYLTDVLSLLLMRRLCLTLFEQIMRYTRPQIFENHLEYYIMPSSILTTSVVLGTLGRSGSLRSIASAVNVAIVTVLVFSPFLFESLAFVHLFARFHLDGQVLFSFALCLLFLIQDSSLILSHYRNTAPPS